MLKLHVVFAIDRAGLVGDDGETHHGVFDVGFLNQVPGLQILSPASAAELKQMLRWAVECCDGPVAVRYPRGGDGCYKDTAWDPASGVAVHRQGTDGALVTYGTMVNQALKAADILEQAGVKISVVRLTKLKGLDIAGLEAALAGQKHVLIAEEASCGIGAGLSALIYDLVPDCKVSVSDLGGSYVTHGSVTELYKMHGLDAGALAERFMEVRQS